MRLPLFILSLLAVVFLSAQEFAISRLGKDFLPSGDSDTVVNYHSQGGVLELSTVFRQDGSRRACWDLPVSLDLSSTAGLRLRFRCVNADLASQIDIYLHADGVWHRAVLSPRTAGKWEELVVSKASFLPEENGNASWRKCDRLRIAAWRGAPGRFSLQFAKVEFQRANVALALVRSGLHDGVSAASRKESLRYAQILGETLVEGGIYPAVVDESDLALGTLKNYHCVVLPAGEATGPDAVNLLCSYLRQGGRIAAFYALPPRLATAMQLPGGKFLKASSLAQPIASIRTNGGASFRQNSAAILAVTAPATENLKFRAWWMDATGHKTPYPAIIQCPYGFWMTHVYLNQDQDHAVPVLAAFLEDFVPGLRQIASLRLIQAAEFALANAGAGQHTAAANALARARGRQNAKDYPGVFVAVSALFEALSEESLPAASAPGGTVAGEMRGGWIRSSTGFPGQDWWKTLRALKLGQCNAIFPHFASPYATAWDSKQVKGRLNHATRDPVSECLAAATSLGFQVHGWVQVLNISDAPEAFRQEMASAGRLQRKPGGSTIPWLCPTQRENRLLMARIVGELARDYPLTGIHLDMLRYEGSAGCCCEHCKAAFGRFAGHPIQGWPQCIQAGGAEVARWEAFRRHQITQLARELAAAARGARPKIQVSAAVYPNLESARKNVGQDWLEWLQKGIVDFVCPMDYRPSVALFQGDLARQRAEAGTLAHCIRPGIGATVHSLSQRELQQQIRAVRSAGLDGYLLFELTPNVATLLSH